MDIEQIERVIRVPIDDTADVELLRSRIDQQTHLIAILKQRSDNTLKKLSELRKNCDKLSVEKEEWQKLLKSEMEQRQTISKHFKTLSQNHDELVKIKDDYKLANEQLRQINSKLANENESKQFPLVQEKEQQLSQLMHTTEQLKLENSSLKKSISELKETLKHNQNELDSAKRNVTSCQHQLTAKETAYDGLVVEVKKLKEAATDSQATWKNERHKLSITLAEKEQSILNKENLIKKLEEDLSHAVAESKSWHAKYKLATEVASKDARVKALTEEINSLNLKYENSVKEAAAYKKHTSELLKQERELNARLRHLVE